MLTLTESAIGAVKDVLAQQSEPFVGVRVAVVGGGCSGFSYAMNFERSQHEGDQLLEFDGFKVFVDEQSLLYLDGTQIDYVETIHGAGFKFVNPNVKGTCGCGESFQV